MKKNQQSNWIINIIVMCGVFFGIYYLMIYQYSKMDKSAYLNIDGYHHLTQFEKDLQCLTLNVYMEAGIESIEGKLAVGIVTMNRVKSKLYPNDICRVVYQSSQFSWTLDRPQNIKNLKSINKAQYDASYEVAKKILIEKFTYSRLDGVLWYHGDYIPPPVWTKNMKLVTKIGKHLFYKK